MTRSIDHACSVTDAGLLMVCPRKSQGLSQGYGAGPGRAVASQNNSSSEVFKSGSPLPALLPLKWAAEGRIQAETYP